MAIVSEDDVMTRLGISKADLDQLVDGGRLTPVEEDGKSGFSRQEVADLEQSGEFGAGQLGDAGLALDDTADEGKVGDDDLFDFAEELDSELIGGSDLETEAEAIQDVAETDLEESDMITEVVNVGDLDAGEEDILGGIIEDVGSDLAPEVEATGEPTGEDTLGMDSGEDITAEITGVEDDIDTGEELTGEITDSEEEAFADQELEEILAGDEGFQADTEAEEFEVPYGAPVAAQPEAPVATWIVAVLVLAFVVLVIGALFAVENASSPQYGTSITKSLSLFPPE